MKGNIRLRLLFFLFFISGALAAQSGIFPYVTPPHAGDQVKPGKQLVYEIDDVQKPPSFPGGEQALLKYLSDGSLPAQDSNKLLISMLVYRFVVGADGSISNIEALQPTPPQGKPYPIQQAYFNRLQTMARWIPGEINGQPVAVRFTLPVRLCFRG